MNRAVDEFRTFIDRCDWVGAFNLARKGQVPPGAIKSTVLMAYRAAVEFDEEQDAQTIRSLFSEYVNEAEFDHASVQKDSAEELIRALGKSTDINEQSKLVVALGKIGDSKAVDPLMQFLKQDSNVPPPPVPPLMDNKNLMAGAYFVLSFTVLTLPLSFLNVSIPIFLVPIIGFLATVIAKPAIKRVYGLMANRVPIWPIFWRYVLASIVAFLFSGLLVVVLLGPIIGSHLALTIILAILAGNILAIPFYGWSVLSLFTREDIQWGKKRDIQLMVRTITALGRLKDHRAVEPIDAVRVLYGEAAIESAASNALKQIQEGNNVS